MGIYKNPMDYDNEILYAYIYIGEFLLKESPSIGIYKGKTLIVFQYMVNTNSPSKHGLRLKAEKINNSDVEISIDIDEKTGAPTLDMKRSDSSLSQKTCKNVAILAGSFAIYALDALRKAFGYFDKGGKYVHGLEQYGIKVMELAQEFNSLPKRERDKYINMAKIWLKIKR